MNKQKGIAHLAVIIVLVAALGVVGYLMLRGNQIKQQPATQDSTTDTSPTPDLNRESDGSTAETADWETYTNEEYGFSLKYPRTLFLKETEGKNLPVVFLNKDPISIPSTYDGYLTTIEIRSKDIFTGLNDFSLENFEAINRGSFYEETLEKQDLPNNLEGYVLSGIGKGPSVEGRELIKAVIGQSGSLEYTLTFLRDEDIDTETFNQILSTFKFID